MNTETIIDTIVGNVTIRKRIHGFGLNVEHKLFAKMPRPKNLELDPDDTSILEETGIEEAFSLLIHGSHNDSDAYFDIGDSCRIVLNKKNIKEIKENISRFIKTKRYTKYIKKADNNEYGEKTILLIFQNDGSENEAYIPMNGLKNVLEILNVFSK